MGNRRGWNAASAKHGTATYKKNDDTTVSLSKAELFASTVGDALQHPAIAQAIVFTDYDSSANDPVTPLADNPDTPENDPIADTAGDDLDYMAAGVWVTGPESEGAVPSYATAGAFAMGKKPYADFTGAQASLTSVKYNGVAGGKQFSGGSIRNFETTVSLTASFLDDATNDPMISGTVDDVGGGQSLALGSATIDTSTAGGAFTGTTHLFETDSDGTKTTVPNFTGTWGGAFFGATDATNGPPGTAGTFGASISADDNNGNSDSILGVFIAHRDDTSSN
ncbi:MAG: hypothetical protein OXE57_17535 [Alphaproteobacteria bacterium]|nr:hypothetical protein [Alphaproteobacteria bacterium]